MHEAETILVVDDETSILDNLADLLALSNFQVLTAGDGLDALAILEVSSPDLIIADVMMPRMNGYQLYHRVRANPAWRFIPFIFLTAKRETEDIRYGKEVGADDYLCKPIEADDLLAVVAGKLQRYQQIRRGVEPSDHSRRAGRYRVGGNLVVDLATHQTVIDAQEVSLSPTEFAILARLILADRAVLDYAHLLGDKEEQTMDERDAAELLRYHVRNLRQKLRESGSDPTLIVNVRNVGYRLAEKPVSISEDGNPLDA